MEYDCHVISLDKLMMNASGVQDPICNDCRSPDCTNPIRDKVISIMGINKTMRLWVAYDQTRQVVACRGYIGDKDVEMGSYEGSVEEI